MYFYFCLKCLARGVQGVTEDDGEVTEDERLKADGEIAGNWTSALSSAALGE